jgi:hypothetical protein
MHVIYGTLHQSLQSLLVAALVSVLSRLGDHMDDRRRIRDPEALEPRRQGSMSSHRTVPAASRRCAAAGNILSHELEPDLRLAQADHAIDPELVGPELEAGPRLPWPAFFV